MRWILLVGVLVFCGCGTKSSYETADRAAMAKFANEAAPPAMSLGLPVETQGRKGVALTSATQDQNVERKIIYTARMEIVVKNFDGVERRVQDIVKDHGGYLASVDLDRMQGESRMGRWTARIPVDRYDEFLKAIAELGVPTSQDQTAQDVTEEFVDLTARIENKKKLESRILELLNRPDDKIQHVIEVEKELARVREEIERMEGRIRFLTDQTAMTTVNLSISEQQDYQPPQAPTFSNRISTAWSSSIDRAVEFFQDSVVFLTGNAITIVGWLFVIALFWVLLGRRCWRRLRQAMARTVREDLETIEGEAG